MAFFGLKFRDLLGCLLHKVESAWLTCASPEKVLSKNLELFDFYLYISPHEVSQKNFIQLVTNWTRFHSARFKSLEKFLTNYYQTNEVHVLLEKSWPSIF